MISRNLAAVFAAVLLALPSAPASQAAPAELAAIAVSLTVQETCLVQSADAAISVANQPVVSCLHGAPFEITEGGIDPAGSANAAQGTARNTAQSTTLSAAQNAARNAPPPVQYAAARDARQTVWTVNF
ncbi:hypothetical protein NDK50_04960 [Paraburkholderia bryophila]|uniref:hypothetical protein n=1 Tax=Paraburkholderia bryophila TaxID=420952 RepID=UPI00234B448E|nr:hypothetical protein [Paraburkholderia bryophila]WCM20823.1 hypothetical protein NDK50_04960 [Paraburkholderia bryophila]